MHIPEVTRQLPDSPAAHGLGLCSPVGQPVMVFTAREAQDGRADPPTQWPCDLGSHSASQGLSFPLQNGDKDVPRLKGAVRKYKMLSAHRWDSTVVSRAARPDPSPPPRSWVMA